MAAKRTWFLALALLIPSMMGASYRTPNFTVEASTPEIAQQIGQYAEHYRKEKAILWLGQEMPNWPQPCPIFANVTRGGAGGATTFNYSQGQVLGQQMEINGSLDRLLNSVLPHEVTHTVFAYHFRQPVPRWADEGGSVLSEDDVERERHDTLVRHILNTPGREIPLRRLFALTRYPDDVMALYAEGFSVANFLVERNNRQTFLAFVSVGMHGDWDGAARRYYGFERVEDLENAWHQQLMNTKRQPAQFARNSAPAEGDPSNRLVVRLTAPPVQPLQEYVPQNSIVRGQAPDTESSSKGGWNSSPRASYEGQPVSAPQYYAPSAPPPGAVMLGTPQFLPTSPASAPSVQLGTPVPGTGYPH